MQNLNKLLADIDVNLNQLLLDPNNPRFAELGQTGEPVPETRIAESRVQDDALKNMKAPRLDLIELRDTIKTVGFLPMDRVVVRQWGGNREDVEPKYVVIEGNRRVAALKWLIDLHETSKITLNDEQLANFTRFPALLLDVKNAPDSTLLVLPGLRHVSGIKGWGAYQQAKAVVELRRQGNSPQEVAQSLGLSTRAANQLWRSYMALEQMRADEEYGEFAAPTLYSYFEEIMKDKNVREWLGWSDTDGKFTVESSVKELYLWMIGEPSEDEESEEREDKKLPEAKSIRQLGKFITDEKALAIFRSPEGSLGRAMSRFDVEHQQEFWQGAVAESDSVLASLTPDNIRAMTEADVNTLKSLGDRIGQVLNDRERLLAG